MTPTKNPAVRQVAEGIAESVLAWRRETLERAGYDGERAERIARSDADLHQAVRLLEQGCDAELAERILT